MSVQPLRDTLEDFFVRQVGAAANQTAGLGAATCTMRTRRCTVAVNVFKESVRDKVLYNLVVFAVLLMAASYLIGQLTAGQDIKIIKDLGLAAIATFGLLIAVFIGIGLVWKEVERRSIYSLLSKPITPVAVHRRQVLRPGADAGGQRGRDGRGVVSRCWPTWPRRSRRRPAPRGRRRPPTRPC